MLNMKNCLTLILLGLLAGCGEEKFEDLKAWIQHASKDLRGKVDPLPEVKPYEAFAYAAFDIVDPFKSSKMQVARPKGGGGIAPDRNRPKQPLESYDLDKLKMVGTLQQNNVTYAIIKAPDKTLYRVKLGSYMGQNFGVITEVTETEVKLKEILEDSSGDWVEKTSSLILEEQEQRK